MHVQSRPSAACSTQAMDCDTDIQAHAHATEVTFIPAMHAGAERAQRSVQLAGFVADQLLSAALDMNTQTSDLTSMTQPLSALRLAAELLVTLGPEAVLMPASSVPRSVLSLGRRSDLI